MKCTFLVARLVRNTPPSISYRHIVLIIAFCLFAAAGDIHAQRSRSKTSSSAMGVLKVQVPSGVLGDSYWIYVNDRLRSSPPHGTINRHNLNIIIMADNSGNWEGWNADGLAVSSARIDQYLKSGDKYGIYSAVEYRVAPGAYSIEMIVPSPRPGAFLRSQTRAEVRAGAPAEVYVAVPAGFSTMPLLPAAPWATGYSLCPSVAQFDLNAATDRLIQWGQNYRRDPVRQALITAVAGYRPGDSVVTLNVDAETREYDGRQIEIIMQRLYGPPYSRGDIDYCRKLLPHYSSTFSEFEATIDDVYRDQEQFKKLAADLSAAKRDR